MSESSPEADPGAEPAGQSESESSSVEEGYALGQTSDPDGAEREEPAGEDYAGSGF